MAWFATAGKRTAKKDLALMALAYRNVYVAQVAFGANDTRTVKASLDADSCPGPSLIIAYAHCIAHGVEMSQGLRQQSRAVACGHWPLFRYDPRLLGQQGRHPLVLDSRPPSISFADYAEAEGRYRAITRSEDPLLLGEAQKDIDLRSRTYQVLSHITE